MRISKETNVEENIIHLENMSDDDRDIDIESEDEDSDTRSQNSKNPNLNFSQAEKRAHHNALERKRRDHIKDSFSSLRESVPHLNNEKVASRAQILKRAAEYIQHMRNKNYSHLQDIQDLKRQNTILENQIRSLERKKASLSEKNHSDNSRDSDQISDVEHEFDVEMANGKKSKMLL